MHIALLFTALASHLSPHGIAQVIGTYSYAAIFLMLFLSGHVIPIPEEIALLSAGYAAGTGVVSLPFTILAALAGLFAGDLMWYAIGLYGGKLIQKLEDRLPRKTMELYQKRMIARPLTTVIAMRFVSGVRLLAPIFAAAWDVPLLLYALADLLALMVYGSIYIFLGFYFHNALATIIHGVGIIRHMIFVVFLCVVAFFIARYVHHIFSRKVKNDGADTSK